MPTRSVDPEGSPAIRWVVRIVVVGAFLATVWLYGPRAVDVLAARVHGAARLSPAVVLDRVGYLERPQWLDRPMLLAVSAELAACLDGTLAILDDEGQRQLRARLVAVPWVAGVAIERVFPDRLRLRCDLRRPVLAVRAADGAPLCLVDRAGVVLPWVDNELPATFLHREGGAPTMTVVPGQRAPDRRVQVAAAIAVEWRDELAPLVDGCPPLLEVDATNLGERWLRGPSYPEVRVKLRRADGAGVVFAYDRPVDSDLPRIPVHTKATVLRQILAGHPGLSGLVAADLRFSRRWADYLQPRPANRQDPNGPWNELHLTTR